MRPLYLLDTNIISEGIKTQPCPRVLEQMARYQGLLAIPSLVWHELLFGLERLEPGAKKKLLHHYVMEVVAPHLPIIPYNDHSAWIHAAFRANLEKSGRVLQLVDSQIAATALAHNMILVTRNSADFIGIPHLMIENWFEDL